MRGTSAITLALILLCAAAPSHAQDDDISLGDLARAVRKQKPVEDEKPVIDNDNLPLMMDKAEAERLDGKPVFSIDPSGKSFRMTSPDGTCSLSFDARAAALISTPYISSYLPTHELAKLEGTAAIHDGFLEVTLSNGTAWQLKEIVVSITLLNQSGAELQPARLVSTIAAQLEARPPDATALYHLKSTSAAGATTTFRAVVDDELNQTKDWHWALVAARGVPPVPAVPGVLANTSVALPAVAQPLSQVQPAPATGTPTSQGETANTASSSQNAVPVTTPSSQPQR